MTIKIEDIIGKGKTFEPPFATDREYDYIRDSRGNVLIETQAIAYRMKYGSYEFRKTIADHIVELLNERWKTE